MNKFFLTIALTASLATPSVAVSNKVIKKRLADANWTEACVVSGDGDFTLSVKGKEGSFVFAKVLEFESGPQQTIGMITLLLIGGGLSNDENFMTLIEENVTKIGSGEAVCFPINPR